MRGLRPGLLLAAVIAGPPLWSLASGGMLDGDTALARWGLVAAGCAVGAEAVVRLANGYDVQTQHRRVVEILSGAVADRTDTTEHREDA
jgi:hypothetical protein